MAEEKKGQEGQTKDDLKGQDKSGQEGQQKDDQGQVDPKIAEIMKDPDAIAHLLRGKAAVTKEVEQLRLKVQKIEDDKKEAEKKALEKQGEWQKLAETEKAEKETIRSQFKQMAVSWHLQIEAVREGINDPGDILLVSQKDLKVSDDFSQVEGVKEAVVALKKAKPYLFKPAGEGGAGGREDYKPGQRGGGGSDENLTPSQRIAKYLEGKK
jgi:rRNA maturation endonuclease Nob1